MFTLDGFIPKLCQLAQEVGEDEKVQNLRVAGLQALSAMVRSIVLLLFFFSGLIKNLNLLDHGTLNFSFEAKVLTINCNLVLILLHLKA